MPTDPSDTHLTDEERANFAPLVESYIHKMWELPEDIRNAHF